MLKKFIPYIKPYRLAAIIGPLLVFAEVVIDILMPLMMASIVDIGIKTSNMEYIYRHGTIMIVLALIALGCGAFSNRLAAIASQGFGYQVRQGLFDKIQDFSFANLDRFSVPSLITRLTNDVNNLQQSVMMGLRMLVRAPFMMILALIMVLSINRRLSMIFLVAIPLLAFSLYFILTSAHPRFRVLQSKIDRMNTSVQETLIGIRVIKSFVRADHEKGRFKESNDSLMKSAVHAVSLVVLNGPIMQLIMYACIVSILWFGGNMVIGGRLLTGQLISFITYVTQILMSLNMLSMLFLMFTRAKASADRILEVFDTDIDIVGKKNGITEAADGSIEYRNVSFRYPGNSMVDDLNQINFRIGSGEIIGIIGSTGSGKSTLVQLLPRLYDATEGEVLLGGRDVKDYDLEALRNAVSMVLQKNTLFTGTIRENLLWGDENATEEEIREACEAVQAWEFISQLPEGLDTVLGQGGVNLSGGQKQRLCIARALLKRPKVLILDDSTSAVDMATDAKIRHAFKTGLKGTTTIIIAQRISSIEHADRIIVMDNGFMDGIGTHEQMLESNSIYREIYTTQLEGSLTA
ncbi:ATP-binding cassette subfamily B protein [Anaerobacterium chartisolvens]|uniref:ATP-binding cassette subfamily B protein n=1 Tax=Anaerobacterium chartisolvens TaxID=1297424 RepID=A0A369BK67_9FIRM|nr:ABC transporter ATP-binding protein [Anaerobacterium chartisolvens]RCX21008.1 ATP-binding cassette subfamily B protein [Anaerobacterium chartisolvens]